MVTLRMIDETGIGNKTLEKSFDFQEPCLTLREIIRQRVFREVGDYNNRQPQVFQGLVEPGQTETLLNGSKPQKVKLLDAQKQYQRAIEAFEQRSFIVLADNIQINDLDEALELEQLRELNFLKLVPLVGG